VLVSVVLAEIVASRRTGNDISRRISNEAAICTCHSSTFQISDWSHHCWWQHLHGSVDDIWMVTN